MRLERYTYRRPAIAYPPVLVPPIISNSCHGSNGVPRFLFKLLMIYFNVIIIDSPRIPPPSKDAHQPMKGYGKH